MATQHYLPPAPLNAESGSLAWAEWYRLLRQSAESGQTAYITINDPTVGLDSKLNSDAADTLGGTISFNSTGAFKVGTVTWDGTTATGTGVMFTQNGIVGASSGSIKFVIKSDGTATFGGQLTAATGSFGAVTVGTGGSISSGKTSFTSTNAGYWIDATSGGRMHIGNSTSYWKWDGTTMLFAGDVITTGGMYATGYANNSITLNGTTYDPSIFGSVTSNFAGGTSTGVLGSCVRTSGGVGIAGSVTGAVTGGNTQISGNFYGSSTTTTGTTIGVKSEIRSSGVCYGALVDLTDTSGSGAHNIYGSSIDTTSSNSSTINTGLLVSQTGGSSNSTALYLASTTGTALTIQQGGIKFNDTSFVGTGAATATLGTNKPGSNSTNTWLKININGTDYYIPVWT